MKKHVYPWVFGVCAFASLHVRAQVGKICNWENDKKAATVITFDDWSPGQFPFVYPALNEKGINATFFVTTKYVIPAIHPWSDAVLTAQAGNEIGNHTIAHPHLKALTPEMLSKEVRVAKHRIDSAVAIQKVVSFAYPFGEGAGTTVADLAVIDSVRNSGHIGARATTKPVYHYKFATKDDDYYRIPTYVMLDTTTRARFAAELDNVIKGGGLLTYLYHSINDLPGGNGQYKDNWYAQVLVDTLKRHFDEVVDRKDRLWVTTFGNAIKYHREKNCATLKQVAAPSNSRWLLELTDTLENNVIFNYPLTLKIPRKGIAYNKVTQKGKTIRVDSIYKDTIVFKAVPDGGTIELSVDGTTALEEEGSLAVFEVTLSPVPTTGKLELKYSYAAKGMQVVVRDMNGVACATPMNIHSQGAQLDFSGYKGGIYTLELTLPDGELLVKKIVVF